MSKTIQLKNRVSHIESYARSRLADGTRKYKRRKWDSKAIKKLNYV